MREYELAGDRRIDDDLVIVSDGGLLRRLR
jgi:hypothetical protein